MELFYSDRIEAGRVLLDAEESGHCVRVLRHRAGDRIEVIDGRGSLLHCTLVDADPRGAEAVIDSETAEFGAHPYHLTMAVCPTKNIDRYEWFVEKATEIGVDRIVPVIGDHSERKVVKDERLKRIAVSAAKQSLKGAMPEISACMSVKDFIASAPEDSLKLICYCDETLPREKRVAVQDALDGSCGGISILIGPEGDFSSDELALAFSTGWQPVHLGASRLRTETAALLAVTAVYLHF